MVSIGIPRARSGVSALTWGEVTSWLQPRNAEASTLANTLGHHGEHVPQGAASPDRCTRTPTDHTYEGRDLPWIGTNRQAPSQPLR